MTLPHDEPNLNDVLDTEEEVTTHRREHAKASPRPDDEELQRRVEIEGEEIGLDAEH